MSSQILLAALQQITGRVNGKRGDGLHIARNKFPPIDAKNGLIKCNLDKAPRCRGYKATLYLNYH